MNMLLSHTDLCFKEWRQYCVPLLASLARHCSNASREIRQVAMTHLQRLILGPLVPVAEGGQRQIEELFSRVIFPMLDDLLKDQVYQRDPADMPETRLRASALLCKAFMHFEVHENLQADIRVLWIQVLDLLDRLMHADRRDQVVNPSSC
jgi:brefeldin A-resistance guanine nucleotide exchange factor 1